MMRRVITSLGRTTFQIRNLGTTRITSYQKNPQQSGGRTSLDEQERLKQQSDEPNKETTEIRANGPESQVNSNKIQQKSEHAPGFGQTIDRTQNASKSDGQADKDMKDMQARSYAQPTMYTQESIQKKSNK